MGFSANLARWSTCALVKESGDDIEMFVGYTTPVVLPSQNFTRKVFFEFKY